MTPDDQRELAIRDSVIAELQQQLTTTQDCLHAQCDLLDHLAAIVQREGDVILKHDGDDFTVLLDNAEPQAVYRTDLGEAIEALYVLVDPGTRIDRAVTAHDGEDRL